jgi:hypothetical protein
LGFAFFLSFLILGLEVYEDTTPDLEIHREAFFNVRDDMPLEYVMHLY